MEDVLYTDHSVVWIASTHGFTNASAFAGGLKLFMVCLRWLSERKKVRLEN